MSNYRNFVSDFPKRCNDLLIRFESHARMGDREVTLMLSIASTGFTIPFERLLERKSSTVICPICNAPFESPATPHPAWDRERHDTAAKKLDRLLDQYFKESDLWDPGHEDDWFYANRIKDVRRELDCWPELVEPKKIGPERQVGKLLKHIRNALAHGNILTRANKYKQIDLIVLLQNERRAEFSMIAVSPHAFREFLRRWFDFLAEADIRYGIIDAEQIA